LVESGYLFINRGEESGGPVKEKPRRECRDIAARKPYWPADFNARDCVTGKPIELGTAEESRNSAASLFMVCCDIR
jgi:hypothetical protein